MEKEESNAIGMTNLDKARELILPPAVPPDPKQVRIKDCVPENLSLADAVEIFRRNVEGWRRACGSSALFWMTFICLPAA